MGPELADLYRNGLRRFDARRFYSTPDCIRFFCEPFVHTVRMTFISAPRFLSRLSFPERP